MRKELSPQECEQILEEVRLTNKKNFGIFVNEAFKNDPTCIRNYYEIRGMLNDLTINVKMSKKVNSDAEDEVKSILEIMEQSKNLGQNLSFCEQKLKVLNKALVASYEMLEEEQAKLDKLMSLRACYEKEADELGYELKEINKDMEVVTGVVAPVPGYFWVLKGDPIDEFEFDIDVITKTIENLFNVCVQPLLIKHNMAGSMSSKSSHNMKGNNILDMLKSMENNDDINDILNSIKNRKNRRR